MSFLFFGGKGFVLFSAASLRAGPWIAATSEGLVHSVVSIATSQAISTPNFTILPTGRALLITLPDILTDDQVGGTEKCKVVETMMEMIDKCKVFNRSLRDE